MVCLSGLHHRLWFRLMAAAWLAAVVVSTSVPAAGGTTEDTRPHDLAALTHLMERFMSRHLVPGAALAVTKNGRLVYAEGFGYGNQEATVPATPTSLFRIASVSKPLTAAAILKLVEEGRLALDAPILPLLRDLLPDANGVPRDDRLGAVTVRHLLRHTAGWDRAQSGFFPLRTSGLMSICEETGTSPPGTPDMVVRHVLTHPLDFDPGSRFAYSNVGYLVLGRIIETVSGQSYENYVREHILLPMGIHDMRIGGSQRSSRLPGEVCYYSAVGAEAEARFGPEKGRRVSLPYRRSIEVQEAAGGWVASVVDLARFVCALQLPGPNGPLDPKTLRLMMSPCVFASGVNPHENSGCYAFGWVVETDELGRTVVSHRGRLPGTGAFMGWRSDGVGAAVLFNVDTISRGDPLLPLFLSEFAPAVDRISSWPDRDGFHIYFPEAESLSSCPREIAVRQGPSPSLRRRIEDPIVIH